jgi:serine/threonine protein kinase
VLPCAGQGRANLREIAHLKEAESLIRAMLVLMPKRRPTIQSVMAHPFWWSSQQRLSFLVDLSDRMENEDREVLCHPLYKNPTLYKTASSPLSFSLKPLLSTRPGIDNRICIVLSDRGP